MAKTKGLTIRQEQRIHKAILKKVEINRNETVGLFGKAFLFLLIVGFMVSGMFMIHSDAAEEVPCKEGWHMVCSENNTNMDILNPYAFAWSLILFIIGFVSTFIAIFFFCEGIDTYYSGLR